MAIESKHSIEDFKSALQNGGVRPTMFSVEMEFPRIVMEAAGLDNGELKKNQNSLSKHHRFLTQPLV